MAAVIKALTYLAFCWLAFPSQLVKRTRWIPNLRMYSLQFPTKWYGLECHCIEGAGGTQLPACPFSIRLYAMMHMHSMMHSIQLSRCIKTTVTLQAMQPHTRCRQRGCSIYVLLHQLPAKRHAWQPACKSNWYYSGSERKQKALHSDCNAAMPLLTWESQIQSWMAELPGTRSGTVDGATTPIGSWKAPSSFSQVNNALPHCSPSAMPFCLAFRSR